MILPKLNRQKIDITSIKFLHFLKCLMNLIYDLIYDNRAPKHFTQGSPRPSLRSCMFEHCYFYNNRYSTRIYTRYVTTRINTRYINTTIYTRHFTTRIYTRYISTTVYIKCINTIIYTVYITTTIYTRQLLPQYVLAVLILQNTLDIIYYNLHCKYIN